MTGPDLDPAESGRSVMPLDTARDMLLHPGGYSRSMVALAASVVVAEYDRRSTAEQEVRAALDVWRNGRLDLAGSHHALIRIARALGVTDEH